MTYADYEDPRLTISARFNRARCPKCRDRVFCPGGDWQKFTNGSKAPIGDPVVMCRDMGHWLGQLSDCIFQEGD